MLTALQSKIYKKKFPLPVSALFTCSAARDTFFPRVMDDDALQSLFNKLSSDESLRKQLFEAIQPQGDDNPSGGGDPATEPLEPQEGAGVNNQLTTNRRQADNLVTDRHQQTGMATDRRQQENTVADRHQTVEQQPGVQEPTEGDKDDTGSSRIPVNEGASGSGLNTFDPSSLAAGDIHVFDAPQIINEYVEKHFRAVLDKETRDIMFKEHPVPSTPVMRAPKVDEFMLGHLKSRFPRSNETQLRTIQNALLSATGPLACLWADFISNDMLTEDSTVSVHDVLEVVQRTLVLLGNANTLLTQTRRDSILQAVDRSLVKYGKECAPTTGDHLFGKDFTSSLKKEVEQDKSLSQIVALNRRHHPYERSRQSTLGRTSKQFFPRGPVGSQGFRQGRYNTPHNKQSFQKQPAFTPKASSSRNFPGKFGKF